MHCNLRPPEQCQSFSAIIRTGCQGWRRWRIKSFCCWYVALRCDLDLWPLTLNICSVLPVKCHQIWTQSSNPRRSYSDSNIWPYDLEDVLQVALAFGIIFTKFDFRQLIRACIMGFYWCWYVMSRCDLDLWPVDLESSWYIKRQVTKVRTKFERSRAIPGWIIEIFANFFTRYVMLWPWLLTSWPWTFTTLRVSCVETMYTIWAKSNNPRQSYWRFRTFSGVRGPNFTKLGRVIGRSFLHKQIVSDSGYCYNVK